MLILPRHLANEARAHKVKRSLSAFIRAAWHVIEPSEYQHGQHIDAMAEHLEAVSTGQIKRLIILFYSCAFAHDFLLACFY